MKLTALGLAAAAALLLTGCPNRTDPKVGAGTPPSPASAPPGASSKCQAADTVAARCQRVGSTRICRLLVAASSPVPVVLPYKLKVGLHGPNREVTIVWELLGDEVEFTDKHGPMRGGKPLRDDPRFKDGWPSNDPDGASKDDPGRYYRITFNNDKATSGSGIEYIITFRNQIAQGATTSQEHACDPMIANESN